MITGIAWDHRRCWGPLDASIEPYRRLTGKDVRWDRRSLYSFGEGQLADYADTYDLVIFDHPFVGDIASEGGFLDLNLFLSAVDRSRFLTDEVGASWRSYAYGNAIWALPIDSAAQTSAFRADLFAQHGFEIPKTIDDVRALAERAAPLGLWIGWPGLPTDLLCTFISIAASMGLTPGHGDGDFVAPSDAEIIFGYLKTLVTVAHPQSKEWNPIRCLDYMSANDDLIYAPYTFNYVNYSSENAPRPISFGTPPAVRPGRPPSTLLGGAGIGISAKSADPKSAFEYAMYLSSPAYQSSDYVTNGGQPGSRTAWQSDSCNAVTNGFFRDTLPVLDQAFVRPTHPGFVPFFHDATLELAQVVHEDAPLRPFVDWLNDRYARIRPTGAVM